jgi:hypothetical protein
MEKSMKIDLESFKSEEVQDIADDIFIAIKDLHEMWNTSDDGEVDYEYIEDIQKRLEMAITRLTVLDDKVQILDSIAYKYEQLMESKEEGD